jgi:hypothetical protein
MVEICINIPIELESHGKALTVILYSFSNGTLNSRRQDII